MMERDAICGGELSQKAAEVAYIIPTSEYRLENEPICGSLVNIKTIMPLYKWPNSVRRHINGKYNTLHL